MAYSSCAGTISASIQIDCAKPLSGGCTGRALLVPLSPAPTFAVNASNSLIIESVTMATGSKMVAIENFGEQPFNGTASASTADGAVQKHTKTVTFDVPLRGAGASKTIVDPLTRLARGFVVIYERRDGKYIVVGYESALRVNADGVSMDEYTKDGVTTITASCSQYNYEYELLDTDAATTQALFETYLAASI